MAALPYKDPTEDLSRFFQLYDSLQREAASLSADRQSLYEARDDHTRLAHELRKTKTAMAINKDYIKEQKDRIELVSTHWFYGSTIYQPQLWFRGGCTGKIERAKVKLAKAEEDRPKLEQIEASLHRREMAANELVRGREAAYGRASDAAKEAKQMKEELVLKHPSNHLNHLEQHEAALRRDIAEENHRKVQLDKIGSVLKDASGCCVSVESLTRSAEKKMRDADHLAKQVVTLSLPDSGSTTTRSLNGGGKEVIKTGSLRHGGSFRDYRKYDAEGNVVLTNRPCPNGCGYVLTWNASYCCTVCCNKQGRRHGGKCERVRVSSQSGAQELWSHLENQREEQARKVEKMRREASSDMDDANRQLQSGSDFLRQAAANLSGSSGGPMPGFSNHGCCTGTPVSCCSVSAQASQLRLQADQLQSNVKNQESVLFQLRREYDRERRRLDQELKQTRSQIVDEKNRIFDALRASAMQQHVNGSHYDPPPATAPHTPPVATATVISVLPEDCVSGSVLGEKV
mmetsp:Transcript_32844/g.48657  ORF Transcript_32844/g.48657 Transcript_32844/m.48657 type:complete len:515 (-) Transcript_32844:997-2541(-)